MLSICKLRILTIFDISDGVNHGTPHNPAIFLASGVFEPRLFECGKPYPCRDGQTSVARGLAQLLVLRLSNEDLDQGFSTVFRRNWRSPPRGAFSLCHGLTMAMKKSWSRGLTW
jgi:hypothetical protein